MIGMLRAMFKPLPSAGDVFTLDSDDPFGNNTTVEVIETKNGWVRYKFCSSYIFLDERMEKSSFNYCYKKITGDKQ